MRVIKQLLLADLTSTNATSGSAKSVSAYSTRFAGVSMLPVPYLIRSSAVYPFSRYPALVVRIGGVVSPE
jgi:hypothetical protein